MILYYNIEISYIIFDKKKNEQNVYIFYKIIKTSHNIKKFILVSNIFSNFYWLYKKAIQYYIISFSYQHIIKNILDLKFVLPKRMQIFTTLNKKLKIKQKIKQVKVNS